MEFMHSTCHLYEELSVPPNSGGSDRGFLLALLIKKQTNKHKTQVSLKKYSGCFLPPPLTLGKKDVKMYIHGHICTFICLMAYDLVLFSLSRAYVTKVS